MSNLENLLRALWWVPGMGGRWGLPLLLEGLPGAAKTGRISQAAAAYGLHLETVIASIREPGDFIGMPVVTPELGVNRAPDLWAKRISEVLGKYSSDAEGVVFFDEFNTAPPAVQSALLRVILEGQVGDLYLPKRIRVVAATNSLEDAANGYALSAPMANRFCHLTGMAPTVAEWSDFILSGGADEIESETVDRRKMEAHVLKLWPNQHAKAKGMVVGFLKRKDMLHQMPKNGDEKASKAWPSHRTWEMAIRALASGMLHGLSETDTDTLVEGFVGRGAALEFANHRREFDLPDPSDILDKKVKWEFDKRLDRTQAVLAACTALVCPTSAEKRVERATALWELFLPLVKGHADLVINNQRALISAKLGLSVCGEAARRVSRAVAPVLFKSGTTPLKEEDLANL